MSGIGGLVVGLLLGLVLAGLLSWLWWRARCAELRAQRDAAQGAAITEITNASAKAAAEFAAQEFRQLEDRAEHTATEDLERRQQALESTVGDLVRPVREQLEQYKQQIDGFQTANTRLQGELKNQLEQLATANAGLQRETSNLATALRRPEVRGGWGEQQLRRIVELAGMLEHCDFDEQVQLIDGSGGRQRPDLIVHLPNAREVIVDAKVPLDAFLEGLATDNPALRDEHMKRHASQLRGHLDTLAKRGYQRGLAHSVDFVVAFVPSDPLLAAAFEYDPAIVERAVADHVLVATPVTLIALLRAVAYGWQQEAVAQNAEHIADAGRELYARLRTLGEHLANLGKRLHSAVDEYNKFVGSFERRVLPQARRFEELRAVAPGTPRVPDATLVTELPQTPLALELATTEGDAAEGEL